MSRISELEEEISSLKERLSAAEAELTQERFRDVPRYERGTIVLVTRRLFGKDRAWPARIERVHLDYGRGEMSDGTPWEKKNVSYAVTLQQKDGEFGGSTEGYHHHQVILPPESDEQAAS